MNTFEEARAIEQEIIAWRRQIHQHPEIGQNLPQTAALVRQKLDEWGVEYREVIPNAFMAYIGKKGGHSILMRADMDALPMDEKTGLPFASQCPGAMHSCGHDTHTAMLLGAAKILKEHESELPGLAILMFQPDEEGLTGARDMIAAGCLEDPKPERAIAIHIAADRLQTGQLAIKSGNCMASSDGFRVTLTGKGGHGASPQDSISPIYAAVKLIGAFEDIARYEIDPQKPTVVNICALHAGSTYNIIPNECQVMGTIRTFDRELRRRADLAAGPAPEGHAPGGRALSLPGRVVYRPKRPQHQERPGLLPESSGPADKGSAGNRLGSPPDRQGHGQRGLLLRHPAHPLGHALPGQHQPGRSGLSRPPSQSGF